MQKMWKAADIIGLVPDELLDNLSSETGVDYSVKKLQGKHIFKLFLFALLDRASISLRILESIFTSDRFQNLFETKSKSIKHAALSFRLKTIQAEYFEKIFLYLIHSPQLENILFDRKKISVSKIDTTIVTLSSKLLKYGLNDNPGYKTLKFGVELHQGIPVNLMLFQKQKELSEDNALPQLIFQCKQKKALNIAIFDRGIQRKQNFIDFHKQGVYFISRVSTQKVTVTKVLPLEKTETKTLHLVSDQNVTFSSNENVKAEDQETEFRMVVGKNKDTHHEMKFLTNVDFLSADEITELYRSRWEIETFFKFIKQQLNFKHLLSRSENGIKVVMYLTMITAILLTIYKKTNNIMGWTVAKIQFLDELFVSTMTEWRTEMEPVFVHLNHAVQPHPD
jgi:hypothetical protein